MLCMDADTMRSWHRTKPQACVVRNEALSFTKLSNDEIETHLTALAERDDEVVAS